MQEKRQKATNHNLIFFKKKNNKKRGFKMVLNGDKTLCSNVGLLKQ